MSSARVVCLFLGGQAGRSQVLYSTGWGLWYRHRTGNLTGILAWWDDNGELKFGRVQSPMMGYYQGRIRCQQNMVEVSIHQ